MENVIEYGAIINKIEWRNKTKLYVTDFSTRKCGMLIKKDLRVSTIDLAMFLDIEHEELISKLDTSKMIKAVYKHYAPEELDPNNWDEKYDFYWIAYRDIEKILIGLNGGCK